MSVTAGGISVTSQGPDGEKRWTIVAAEADAELTPDGAYGGLRDVALTLYRDEQAYLAVKGKEGWANSELGEFRIVGGVEAATPDGKSRFWTETLRGDRRAGSVRAEGGVRASFDGMTMGAAKSADATFDGARGGEPRLKTIQVQGDAVWFESADKSIRITGVSTGETGYGEDGKTVDFKLEGAPVRFTWRDRGLTITSRRFDATLIKMEDGDFRLASGTFVQGVRIDLSGTERGQAWEATSSAPSATYSGSAAEFSLTGGAEIRSTHPSLAGKFVSPSISVGFDKRQIDSGGGYKPISLSARGTGTSYAADDGRLDVRGLTFVDVKETDAENVMSFQGRGTPLVLTAKGADSGLLIVKSASLTGRMKRGDGGETTLERAQAESGISADLSGVTGPEKSAWSLSGGADTMEYVRSESRMTLLGVREVVGRHPTLPTGAGTLYAPRVDVTFYAGTFNPKSIRTSRGAN
jgi:hypothetical protein